VEIEWISNLNENPCCFLMISGEMMVFGSSCALPRGSWDVFRGSVVPGEPRAISMYKGWSFFKKKGSRDAKSRKSVNKL